MGPLGEASLGRWALLHKPGPTPQYSAPPQIGAFRLFLGADVPDLDGAIVGGGGDEPAVHGPRDHVHRADVGSEGGNELPGVPVPESDGLIKGCGGNKPPVWREGDVVHDLSVPSKSVDGFPAVLPERVPKKHGVVVGPGKKPLELALLLKVLDGELGRRDLFENGLELELEVSSGRVVAGRPCDVVRVHGQSIHPVGVALEVSQELAGLRVPNLYQGVSGRANDVFLGNAAPLNAGNHLGVRSQGVYNGAGRDVPDLQAKVLRGADELRAVEGFRERLGTPPRPGKIRVRRELHQVQGLPGEGDHGLGVALESPENFLSFGGVPNADGVVHPRRSQQGGVWGPCQGQDPVRVALKAHFRSLRQKVPKSNGRVSGASGEEVAVRAKAAAQNRVFVAL
ncbi:hypothetical protein HWI79_3198 [Cryptosporidium felis]|nr:hypothetical protein HWI79_3198 [Cryptosporidium felis]